MRANLYAWVSVQLQAEEYRRQRESEQLPTVVQKRLKISDKKSQPLLSCSRAHTSIGHIVVRGAK
ncbi:MAG: hypothetical protein A3J55_01535 [Candidatus Ryanbacteria bacterium RIFCSPHIGHO2_02_FULL_45_17b]|nr:MAG: hypothetical protein A3J55_01535 [Candidatus Ryanbacteria bacterium RIFCSPHIGHO2_02_FULL_45_17b]